MSNAILENNVRIRNLEYSLEENVWNRLQIISNSLTTEKTSQLKKECKLLRKHLTLNNIVDYYKIMGEIDIRKILSKYLQSEKLLEEDIQILKEYFWFSNYKDYMLDFYNQKELTNIDTKLAYYSATFSEEDKKVLNKINKHYKIFSNTNDDRIEYLQYILSLNSLVINNERFEKLEIDLKNSLNLIQKLQIKYELLRIRKKIQNDRYSYIMYLKHNGELQIRQVLEKFNNKEQLSKEEVEIIKEYFRTINYFENRIFSGSFENFEYSYVGQLYYKYSTDFNEEELIKMKKISKKY